METTPPSIPSVTNIPPVPGVPAPAQLSSANSASAVMALILGILSLICCGFFSGIPAIFIGRSELKKIEEGKSNVSNRGFAKVGMILGIVGTTLNLIVILIWIVLFILGISTGAFQDFSR